MKNPYGNRVVLVTTTFTKSMDDIRAQLTIRTCIAAVACGYTIIVVDGSKDCPEFKMALRQTGAKVFDQILPGMGQSRRECMLLGLGTQAEVVIWLEPEKHPIVPLLAQCIEPVINDHVDLVIPRRQSFQNYPQYQEISELRANWALGSITGMPELDLYIGTRVMSARNAAQHFADYDGKIDGVQTYGDNWEILFIPVLHLLSRGRRIQSVTVDYVHPIEQLVEDDEAMRAKRDKQRFDLVSAMTAEAKRLDLESLLV